MKWSYGIKCVDITCVKCIIVHYECVLICMYNNIFYNVVNMHTSVLINTYENCNKIHIT